MPFPIKTCAVCGEEFELKPGKPGFANRCLECSVNDEPEDTLATRAMNADTLSGVKEAAESRRAAMRNLLYRKDS
ncbi:MAG: hypothetical protein KGK08_04935 [Acidobacteriota bacterium]|nr:hypothetical protein [Acidobacteriota bacterium]